MKEELFVSYELAKQLEEKGFNERCLAYYYHTKTFDQERRLNIAKFGTIVEPFAGEFIFVPMYQQVVDWFREKHNLHFYIDTTAVFDKMYPSQYRVYIKVPFQPFKWTTGYYYRGNTYYEALENAIKAAIKLI